MSKKKFLQTNNTEEYLEFLSDNELIDKIREIVKEKLTIEQAVSIPNIKNILMSEHYETFRKQQYSKLENIYKTHWYRNKFYGFLEKDEYSYGFDTFFELIYTHIDKIYNLDIIFENDDLLLQVFEELGFKNEL